MFQSPLPLAYSELGEEETHERILRARTLLGERLVILGHHYQRDEIIRHADFRGDSFKLCKQASARPEAEFIVFCGVHFMAESADILTADHQQVILPNLSAGCSMADMANIYQVRTCWDELSTLFPPASIVPITYMNSAADLKAFVGERGGAVCTSSNAPAIMTWALERGEKVLFFPDQHLGRATAWKMGFDVERDCALWDPHQPMGGNDDATLRRAKILLWKGLCSVHGRFRMAQVEAMRAVHPGIQVIVHPECTLDMVQTAEFYGSTEFIINKVSESPPGSKWAVGTEINLVKRLQSENPDKLVVCLDPIVCPCSTMYRIHPSFLLWVLEGLVEGEVRNRISVPANTAQFALLGLERMLEIT